MHLESYGKTAPSKSSKTIEISICVCDFKNLWSKIRSENLISDYFETKKNPHIFESMELSNTFQSVVIWKMRKFKAGQFFLRTVKVGVEKCFKTQVSKFEDWISSAVILGKEAYPHLFESSKVQNNSISLCYSKMSKIRAGQIFLKAFEWTEIVSGSIF